MNNSLKLPPFGVILQAYQKSKVHLKTIIRIYVGQKASQEAYDGIQYGTLCTYLPYGEDYKDYDWPINNQNIVLEDTDLTSISMLRKMSLYLLNIHTPHYIFLVSRSLEEPELFTIKQEGVSNVG